jgi:hypothetical protein
VFIHPRELWTQTIFLANFVVIQQFKNNATRNKQIEESDYMNSVRRSWSTSPTLEHSIQEKIHE